MAGPHHPVWLIKIIKAIWGGWGQAAAEHCMRGVFANGVRVCGSALEEMYLCICVKSEDQRLKKIVHTDICTGDT